MRHAPPDRTFLVVARNEQRRFVGIVGLFPDVFLVWIAPAENRFDGIEAVDHVMHVTPWIAGCESVIAGCRVVEDGGFWNAFGHDQILP